MQKIFFLFLFTLFTFCCLAQEETKTKVFDHYIGMQANQLFKQFLNLDASNTIVDNPYLLTYSTCYSKWHLGLQGGFGYNYSKTKDKLSPSALQSTINEVFYRFGITKNFILGTKWEASAAVNYIGNYILDKTVAFSVVKSQGATVIDSTATIATSLVKRKGAELQLSIGVHLSKHVMLFTEASLDYNSDSNKNNVLITETTTNTMFPENDDYTLSASNSDVMNSTFEINPPLALFIVVKF